MIPVSTQIEQRKALLRLQLETRQEVLAETDPACCDLRGRLAELNNLAVVPPPEPDSA